MNDLIYTHDEAMLIVEMFEDILAKNNIYIPSPEDDDREPGDIVGLYGSVYSDLLDEVEEKLCVILYRQSNGAEIIEGRFSGTV